MTFSFDKLLFQIIVPWTYVLREIPLPPYQESAAAAAAADDDDDDDDDAVVAALVLFLNLVLILDHNYKHQEFFLTFLQLQKDNSQKRNHHYLTFCIRFV